MIHLNGNVGIEFFPALLHIYLARPVEFQLVGIDPEDFKLCIDGGVPKEGRYDTERKLFEYKTMFFGEIMVELYMIDSCANHSYFILKTEDWQCHCITGSDALIMVYGDRERFEIDLTLIALTC